MAEAAKSDRIGRGGAPVVQPLAGVLDKLLQIKQRAIDRCGSHRSDFADRTMLRAALPLAAQQAFCMPAWALGPADAMHMGMH